MNTVKLLEPEQGLDYFDMLQINLDQVTPPADKTLRLQLGDISCAIVCPDNEMYLQLLRVYHEYETEQSPDITIQLEATNRLSVEKLEASLLKTMFIPRNKQSFTTSSRIISGDYNMEKRVFKIKGEKALLNPDLKINNLNRLLILSYYTASKLKFDDTPPAMFVHTCGILRDGKALLFTGPSGAGKTTIARLCGQQDGEVINDEMLLISRPDHNGKGIDVISAPMLGAFSPRRNITAPLKCIFLLKQSQQTRACALSKTEAYVQFIRQIISPACIGQKNRKAIYSMMADFSSQITGSIPMYELEFNLDVKSLWHTVEDVERALDIKER